MVDWYRGDPRADLEDAKGLTFEEFGAYRMVLALIRLRNGALPDDERLVSQGCRCELRTWRRIRAQLIACERLYVRDGMLRHPGVDAEVAAASRRQAVAQAAGRASGLSRRNGSSDLNDLAEPDVREAGPGDTDEEAHTGRPLLAHRREEARAEIAAHLATLGPYEMQDLAAGLLQAMGYATTTVAAPGPDGGTDILAYEDALGAATPHLRVQVKHRAESAGREEIAALRGIVKPGREIGLFISTGGFTREARREAQSGTAHIRLVDLDDFLALWIRHYDDLPEAARAKLRLKPVWFLDVEHEAITCHVSRRIALLRS